MRESIRYVGDLSKADAAVLEHYSHMASAILEFGAGASTQIFAQANPSALISVETDPSWVERTQVNLKTLKIKKEVQFHSPDTAPRRKYDLIFVDGRWDLRQAFALEWWPYLSENGFMIFHDTRRWFDADNVAVILKNYHNEIESIHVNYALSSEYGRSNCTIIRKGEKIEYQKWNEVEGKEPWMWGDGEPQELERWPTV